MTIAWHSHVYPERGQPPKKYQQRCTKKVNARSCGLQIYFRLCDNANHQYNLDCNILETNCEILKSPCLEALQSALFSSDSSLGFVGESLKWSCNQMGPSHPAFSRVLPPSCHTKNKIENISGYANSELSFSQSTFSDIDIWGTEEAPAPNVETVDNNKTENIGERDWCSASGVVVNKIMTLI